MAVITMFDLDHICWELRNNHHDHQWHDFYVDISCIGTVEPRYDEVRRRWQNFFAITRLRYIEVLSPYSTITRVKKIARHYTEDFVI